MGALPNQLCAVQQQQQQPDAMNFDTQACADVLSMDLGIISGGASPVPQPGAMHELLLLLMVASLR